MKSLAALFLLAVGAVAAQETPAPDAFEPAEPTDHHAWLQQLVGEWTARSEMPTGPGADPMVVTSTQSVRSIGGLWIVGDSTGDFGGTEITSMLTLGYDPREDAFVGTWVDSMLDYMWTYRGTLDEAGTTLALEARGPRFDGREGMANYRDSIEIVDADHYRMHSAVQADDGTWSTMMTADYERRAPTTDASAPSRPSRSDTDG